MTTYKYVPAYPANDEQRACDHDWKQTRHLGSQYGTLIEFICNICGCRGKIDTNG